MKEILEVHLRNSKQQKHVQNPKGIYGSKAYRNSFLEGTSGSALAELKTAKARTEPERNLWEQSGQKFLSWGGALEVHLRNSKQQKHEQSPKGIYGSKADRKSFREGNSGSAHAELKTAKARTEPERNLWEQSGQKFLSWGGALEVLLRYSK